MKTLMFRRVGRGLCVVLWLLAVVVLGFCIPSIWMKPDSGSWVKDHDGPVEPFYAGVGDYSRRITTKSAVAQKYFDQGLAFLYAYNQPAAMHSFAAVVAEDSHCAMGYWGLAMASGPFFNKTTLMPDEAISAHNAVNCAGELASTAATLVERRLIEALSNRFGDDPAAKRESLDAAYANAMRQVHLQFPDDADVGALTAEALLDLHPWDQWALDGRARPGTEEVLSVLHATLAKAPHHPFALHLLIHTLEGSPHPEGAAGAAEFLRTWAPGLEHLIHMPSHIDCRLGQWQAAVTCNEKAIAAEKGYRAAAQRDEPYRLWPTHNYEMLAYAAMMEGCERKARAAIVEVLSTMPDDFVEQYKMYVEALFSMPYELCLRFGRWDEMLASAAPRRELPLTTALWHYGRGIAFAAQHHVTAATAEQSLYSAAVNRVPRDYKYRGTSVSRILCITSNMLKGEIVYREGKIAQALQCLREAVREEDQLRYAEPPLWPVPARHALGAALMDAHFYRDAEVVYREDLCRRRENGWSLYGLAHSLKMQGKTKEADAVLLRFKEAWKYADFRICSSCCCLPIKTKPLSE